MWAAPARAASTSPSLRRFICGDPAARAAACLSKLAVDCLEVGWSAHWVFSWLRPLRAAHQVSPTTATPGSRPERSAPPSMTNTFLTPFTARAASRSAEATFAPNTGAFSKVA